MIKWDLSHIWKVDLTFKNQSCDLLQKVNKEEKTLHREIFISVDAEKMFS